MNTETLLSTHDAYSNHAKQADFLYRSYVGGKLYQKGEYLVKYFGEQNTPGDAYNKRIMSTPIDNHVKTTVDIYSSFIFRNLPKRTLGGLVNNPTVQDFIKDTDQDGSTMDAFMKSVNDMALVLGNVWLLVDKPSYAVQTQAQAQALGLKGYVCAYTPQNVLDWNYTRAVTGKKILDYIKVVEHEDTNHALISIWYPDRIERYTVEKDEQGEHTGIINEELYSNPLGYVPFINYAPLPSPTKGVGFSLVGDVALAQKYIYNLLSELEQNIRISGHPSLVKTPSTRATAGAGAIIEVQDDMDPGLKPYLLQPSGSSIDGILDAIDKIVHAIHRMTHTSAVQIMRGSPMSGTALKTERQLLNTKLADISQHLQETELKIWNMWFDWEGITKSNEFDIEYADTFDIEDEHADLELYGKALKTVSDPMFTTEVNKMVAELIVKDEAKLQEIHNSMESVPEEQPTEMEHPVTDPQNRREHILEMIAQGLSDSEMLDLHPEIGQEDINRARTAE